MSSLTELGIQRAAGTSLRYSSLVTVSSSVRSVFHPLRAVQCTKDNSKLKQPSERFIVRTILRAFGIKALRLPE